MYIYFRPIITVINCDIVNSGIIQFSLLSTESQFYILTSLNYLSESVNF